MNNKKKHKKKDLYKEIFNSIRKSHLEDLIVANSKILKGKSIAEIEQMINLDIKKFVNDPNLEFQLITDYTSNLIRMARSHLKDGQEELSAVFYATYFEHKINYIIHMLAKKRKLSESVINKIYKKFDLEDKSAWVLEIMGIKSIPANHQKIIKAISDIRNNYIHFKWNPVDQGSRVGRKRIIEKAEITVRYLKKFEEKVVYKGMRKKIVKSFETL